MTDKQRVVILSSIQSERLHYVLEEIFTQRLKVHYVLTENENDISEEDCVIEYNITSKSHYDFIQAHDIIEKTSIDVYFKPEISGSGEELKIFPFDNSLFDMDLFSAVFYCLSHYDAYTQSEFDNHQRIRFGQWFPRVSGLDRFPYVDIWIELLKNHLDLKGFDLNGTHFEQDISFDIDHFYLLDQRPFLQHLKASAGDIFRLRFFQLFQRWLVILGLTEDPAEKFFDLLDYQFNAKLTFFVLMKHGRHNSLNPLNELKKLLIKKLSKYGQIGIHPSYQSSIKNELIIKEKQQLSNILNEGIEESRFHFLRVKFPSSFYALNKSGIKTDKSIGYYDQPGFLSSTSIPYYFFDPVSNTKIDLIIEPFVWMDSMNRYYRDINEADEKKELFYYKSLVKKYKGKFSVVFHNDSMIDRRYRKLFKSLLYN